MKKFLTLLLAAAMTLSLAACGSKMTIAAITASPRALSSC